MNEWPRVRTKNIPALYKTREAVIETGPFRPADSEKATPPTMAERNLYAIIGFLLLVAIGYLNWPGGGGGGFPLKIPIPWLQPDMSFVGRNGTRFVDLATGSPVYVNGWNSYWMVSSGSPGSVKEMLQGGRAMGMTVCRTWAFNDGGPNALQISPGRFDERIFQVFSFDSDSDLLFCCSYCVGIRAQVFKESSYCRKRTILFSP